ncbi:hypothetical protein [uncultured Draconibacterium sp.]|uniref:hypothetical protein n=1 Tax=uncultured Draconibacterium sp. TaxID=1573823 RepID=UPI0025F4ADD7|nr:hypothetical protein [uncultured Draconibacterium sp.]
MLYAKDERNNKIKPYKGRIAKCPYCHEKVIAVCGEINIHHWRHDRSADCDPWKEHETEWHREWKQEFPEGWRESIILKNGEKHIADVHTDRGVVLELQNSSISTSTIRIRENFYDKMIWLVNADYFKDNFMIRSEVTSRLRKLKYNYEYQINDISDYDDRLEERREDIRKVGQKIESLQRKLEWEQDKLDKFQKFKENFEERFEIYINSGCYLSEIWDFESEIIPKLKNIKTEIEETESEILFQGKKVDKINGFSSVAISGYESYRYVGFNEISANFYNLCKVVKKDTINSFFPEVSDLKSELEFSRRAYSQNQYLLIADLTENLSYINNTLSDLQQKSDSLKGELVLKHQQLKSELLNWLANEILIQEDKTYAVKQKIDKKLIEHQECIDDLNSENKMLEQESETLQKMLKEDCQKKEVEIKRTHKGFYTFQWKHRRKTWDFAEKPLFLDFGTHIFRVISEDRLQKLSISDFIQIIKSWQ